jgi:hypothetical protein
MGGILSSIPAFLPRSSLQWAAHSSRVGSSLSHIYVSASFISLAGMGVLDLHGARPISWPILCCVAAVVMARDHRTRAEQFASAHAASAFAFAKWYAGYQLGQS